MWVVRKHRQKKSNRCPWFGGISPFDFLLCAYKICNQTFSIHLHCFIFAVDFWSVKCAFFKNCNLTNFDKSWNWKNKTLFDHFVSFFEKDKISWCKNSNWVSLLNVAHFTEQNTFLIALNCMFETALRELM